MTGRLPLALALAAAVAVAVTVALWTVGGPVTARLERYDERRVRDVNELVHALERHRVLTGSLPRSLGEVREGLSGPPPTRDPETGEPYEYEVLAEKRFRVCIRLSHRQGPPPSAGPVRTGEPRRVVDVAQDADGRLCWESTDTPG